MTQTLAIFLDAYRSLNSKRLFWIVLALSGLVVAAFACLGINDHGLKICFWQFDDQMFNARNIPPNLFYKTLFSFFGVGIWLAWVATSLALVSTAGIFPDMLTQGSIDVYVSKPISRLRLFITEYLAGLMFVALQVIVFTASSFLVLGFRGGIWAPGLFWAVPIMVCFFSYLYSVCVLLGVWTRSTMASLLLTILFWACLCLVDRGEQWLLLMANSEKQGVSLFTPPMDDDIKPKTKVKESHPASENEGEGIFSLDHMHSLVYGFKTIIPKLSETLTLLDRQLDDATQIDKHPLGSDDNQRRRHRAETLHLAATKTSDEIIHRPVSWVIGTSLAFEFVVLAVAATLFCRRDY